MLMLSVSRIRVQLSSAFSLRSFSTVFNPTQEHSSFREMLRNFAEKEVLPAALESNRLETPNLALFHRVAELGALGLTISPKYGGCGMDATAVVISAEELSAADPSFALFYGAHANLFGNNLFQNGSDEQRLRYLPSICSGKKIGGMCMSESGSGTDVFGMQTRAAESADGTVFSLTGSKMWITNGTTDNRELGDVFIVYAKTGCGRGIRDLSAFIVEKGMPGFSLGQVVKDKCGMRAAGTAKLLFEDVKVPRANLIGEVGSGALCMMRNLEIERLALAGMSLGIARKCIEVMSQYAQERMAFGRKIGEFGQIQKMISESYSEFLAGRHYVYNTANNLDLSTMGNGLESDGVKLNCAPMAKRVADRAMQVLGGNGYTGAYVVERLWRDSKLVEIGGGTNEAHHKNMIRDINRLQNRIA